MGVMVAPVNKLIHMKNNAWFQLKITYIIQRPNLVGPNSFDSFYVHLKFTISSSKPNAEDSIND